MMIRESEDCARKNRRTRKRVSDFVFSAILISPSPSSSLSSSPSLSSSSSSSHRGRGGGCEMCPCPLTNPSNQFATSCFLDQDDQVTKKRREDFLVVLAKCSKARGHQKFLPEVVIENPNACFTTAFQPHFPTYNKQVVRQCSHLKVCSGPMRSFLPWLHFLF